ncbi:brevican core protein-like isoform X2 [Biomphalaria glabrata]|uniref:Brevican core protein-like isoform X2 n=1 Tax=Biomphalaria glabrata TaxID=6526 RepID=A0A9W3A2C5_BIOGL|nr:brevican core protein-like isoform X2 [Biomphalaria glabrata]
MLWFVALTTSLLLLSLNSAVHFRYNTTSFVQRAGDFCWPIRLNTTWTSTSRVECAIRCLQSYKDNCKCFVYSRETSLCTPCSGLTANLTYFTDDGDVYLVDSCSLYPDFSYHNYSSGTATVYAAFYSNNLTYAQAEDTCRCMKAQLFVAKSWEKFLVFASMADSALEYWIGLDDRAQEGNFVWADGQEINSSLESMMFATDQPDNGDYGPENCVYKLKSGADENPVLNDGFCDLHLPYVCEKPQC